MVSWHFYFNIQSLSPPLFCKSDILIFLSDPTFECFEVSMYKPKQDYTWSFGHCSASQKWFGAGTYIDECCISKGKHILTCSTGSSGKSDWSNSVVMLLGHRFCDDFVGRNTFMEWGQRGKNG